jgi:hypothetical protein
MNRSRNANAGYSILRNHRPTQGILGTIWGPFNRPVIDQPRDDV